MGIVFCQVSYNEDEPNTKICIENIRPYVDRVVVIHDGTLSKEMLEWLKEKNCEAYMHPWQDSTSIQRNQYLERLEEGDWACVSDPDEQYGELLCKEIRELIERAERVGVNQISLNCHDTWLKENGSKEEHESDYYKPLIFRYIKGMRYEGIIHETLMAPPHVTWKIGKASPKYFYRHIKSYATVWRNAVRNMWCCLLPNQPIITDKGVKDITEVKVSEKVLGDSFDVVEATFERPYNGTVYEIKGMGLLPFTVTEEHPILLARVRWEWTPNTKWKRIVVSNVWKEAKELNVEGLAFTKERREDVEYLVFPKLKIEKPIRKVSLLPYCGRCGRKRRGRKMLLMKEVPINEETAQLLGFYLAEGWATSGVQLSFGLHEERLALKAIEIAKRHFPYKVGMFRRETAIVVYLGGKVLRRFMREQFGSKATEKRIPPFILYNRKEILEAFLNAYFKGDGNIHRGDGERHLPHDVYTTSSKTLALQLQLAFSKLDKFASVEEDKREGETTIKGRTVHQADRYLVRVIHRKRKRKFLEDEYAFYLPIRRIFRFKYSGTVYNLRTESHIFTISNILVHNCGGGDNFIGNPHWTELRSITDSLGINTWKELDAYLKKGNIDPRLKEWIIKRKDIDEEKWHSELREWYLYYFHHLHPEEAPTRRELEIQHWGVGSPVIPKGGYAEFILGLRRLYREHLGREPSKCEQDYFWGQRQKGLDVAAIEEVLKNPDRYPTPVFVAQQYHEVLKREADPSGLHTYSTLINLGKLRREDLPRVLAGSPEARGEREIGLEFGREGAMQKIVVRENDVMKFISEVFNLCSLILQGKISSFTIGIQERRKE